MTKAERGEFTLYLRGCTNAQLLNVYAKERLARRRGYAALARAELERRGLTW